MSTDLIDHSLSEEMRAACDDYSLYSRVHDLECELSDEKARAEAAEAKLRTYRDLCERSKKYLGRWFSSLKGDELRLWQDLHVALTMQPELVASSIEQPPTRTEEIHAKCGTVLQPENFYITGIGAYCPKCGHCPNKEIVTRNVETSVQQPQTAPAGYTWKTLYTSIAESGYYANLIRDIDGADLGTIVRVRSDKWCVYDKEGVFLAQQKSFVEAKVTAEQALAQIEQPQPSREHRVGDWVITRIGKAHMQSRERAIRLLEESIELAQAEGITAEQVSKQSAHVFSRPPGTPRQEAAGVAVCLLGWCAANETTFEALADEEIARIEAKPIDQIRGSVARKNDADLVVAVQQSQTAQPGDTDPK